MINAKKSKTHINFGYCFIRFNETSRALLISIFIVLLSSIQVYSSKY